MGYLIRYMELENLPSLRANKICYFPKDDKVVKTNKYSFSLFLHLNSLSMTVMVYS